MYIMRKHEMDPMPGRGVYLGRNWTGLTKAEVRENTCSVFKSDFEMWYQGCTSNPNHKPYAYDPRPEVHAMTCQDQVTVKKHLYENCMAPQNSISCSGRGFWAMARTAYKDEFLPSGEVSHFTERPAVGGATCGKKSAKAAAQAALAACDKARVAKGLVDVKCLIYEQAELK